MEVHHHSHPSANSGHRKKWKHYFWEFLMLFLAVFCGFLAEYELEHVIEHQREKKLIQSFVGDLRTDNDAFSEYQNFSERSETVFDTLFSLLEKYKTGEPAANIYRLMRIGLNWRPMIFSRGTLEQLKNAGGFRLIRKQNVIDSIQQYEKLSERIRGIDGKIEKLQLDYRDLLGKISDARFFKYTGDAYNIDSIGNHAVLRMYDAENFNQFLIKIDFIRNNIRVSLKFLLPEVKEDGERLIEFLKKEYHLN
ncbi:MAG TPA: hypothetical protein PKC72_01585 [Chitinophagaceae bacterium]|nr:hypothetical protein [Chitinophagaceae bacterium]